MNKENRPPADVAPTDDESEGGSPITSSSPITWKHDFFSNFGATASMGPHASGDEWVECARVRADLSRMKKGRWGMQSHVMVAGHTTAEYVTRYSINGGTSFTDGPKVSLATASATLPRVGSRLVIPDEAAINDVLLALARRGGNGTLSPETWNAIIEAVSASPRTPTGDLPGGMAALLDLDPARLTEYGDDESVLQWDDFSGNTNHAVPNSGSPWFQLPGEFKTNAFGTGVHGVRIDGAGDGFMIDDIPDGFNNQTWYFVFRDATGMGSNGNGGPGNALLMSTADGIGGENGWVSIRGDGRLQTGVNASAFGQTGTLGNTDTFDDSGVHVVTVVWEKTAFQWRVYGDRVLNHTISDAVVGNNWVNPSMILFGNAAVASNTLLATYGRVLCMAGAHDTTDRETMWDYFSDKYGAP